jgi:hypothetical protein
VTAAELGHVTSHMPEEIDRLRANDGWNRSATWHPMDTHRVSSSECPRKRLRK